MADVNDIVVFGFGSWSSVYSIPTLGFGIGPTAVAGLEFTAPEMLLQYTDRTGLMHYSAPGGRVDFTDDTAPAHFSAPGGPLHWTAVGE